MDLNLLDPLELGDATLDPDGTGGATPLSVRGVGSDAVVGSVLLYLAAMLYEVVYGRL